ncbi:MAG TPA: hypothetical protein VIV11_32950 [Kofleriaceae bacterium]
MALSIALAGGCYAPELRDCTLTCSAATDCADGQVCDSEGFCAAPEIAGTCSSLPGHAGGNDRDAGIDAPKINDARPDAAPDAMTHVLLAITIESKGRVIVQTIGTCEQSGPQNGSCVFYVPRDVELTVQAQPYSDHRFDRWTTTTCMSAPATCMFTPTSATPLGVKFRKDDD